MLLHTPEGSLGNPPAPFSLPDAYGETHHLYNLMGPNGILIAFICNHCPYVIDIMPRFVEDAAALNDAGVGVVCINANDYAAYPADAPEKMPAFAAKFGLTAPYLVDAEQSTARSYGAVCTPDFFGFGRETGLQYRGRLDDVRKGGDGANRTPELRDAMQLIAKTGAGPKTQTPAMGCSLKWK